MEGLVALAGEPGLRARVLASMGIGETKEPLDALFDRALQHLGCALHALRGLGGGVAVHRPAPAARQHAFAVTFDAEDSKRDLSSTRRPLTLCLTLQQKLTRVGNSRYDWLAHCPLVPEHSVVRSSGENARKRKCCDKRKERHSIRSDPQIHGSQKILKNTVGFVQPAPFQNLQGKIKNQICQIVWDNPSFKGFFEFLKGFFLRPRAGS